MAFSEYDGIRRNDQDLCNLHLQLRRPIITFSTWDGAGNDKAHMDVMYQPLIMRRIVEDLVDVLRGKGRISVSFNH